MLDLSNWVASSIEYVDEGRIGIILLIDLEA